MSHHGPWCCLFPQFFLLSFAREAQTCVLPREVSLWGCVGGPASYTQPLPLPSLTHLLILLTLLIPSAHGACARCTGLGFVSCVLNSYLHNRGRRSGTCSDFPPPKPDFPQVQGGSRNVL